jgi:hypothetical protein
MTEKEIIVNLYSEGKSYTEIQEETGFSQETISDHLGFGLLAKMQEIQMRCYKSEPSWHLPPGSPTAILMAARSIYKDDPKTLARFEKEYEDSLARHTAEKPGTWVNGTWYAWDFENGYPWSNPEVAYKFKK